MTLEALFLRLVFFTIFFNLYLCTEYLGKAKNGKHYIVSVENSKRMSSPPNATPTEKDYGLLDGVLGMAQNAASSGDKDGSSDDGSTKKAEDTGGKPSGIMGLADGLMNNDGKDKDKETDEDKKSNESKDSKDSKETNESKESKASTESNTSDKSNESNESSESKEDKKSGESNGSKEGKEII